MLTLTRGFDTMAHRARGSVISRLLRRPLAVLGICAFGVVLIPSLLAPWIAPYAAGYITSAPSFAPPSWGHLFGTDKIGEDTFSRLLYAGRTDLVIVFLSLGLATVIGSTIGLVTGYILGTIDLLVQRVMDSITAFPQFVLALILSQSLGASETSLVLALGISLMPAIQRVVRSVIIAERQALYVDAARVSGLSPFRILSRHLSPQVASPLLVVVTSLFPIAVITESAIIFVGAGLPITTPTWGGMLSQGIDASPLLSRWLILFPSLVIFLVCFSANVLGDALRDVLDPRSFEMTPSRRLGRFRMKFSLLNPVSAISDSKGSAIAKNRTMAVSVPASLGGRSSRQES